MFAVLYAVILGALVGAVQLLQIQLPPDEPEVAPQPVAEFIAVPPKPEGAQVSEGDGEGQLSTDEGCRARNDGYREACFHALALQRAERDPEGALEACDELDDDRLECIADVAELHSTVDRGWSENTCATLIPVEQRKWHGQCWFGIALAWSTEDYDYARGTCEKALDWRNFCRHDVNGEIAQVDPQAAFDWCRMTPMSDLQLKGCYHGLGKYLGRVDVPKALETCRRVPDEQVIHPQQCFHGLGWAVAESDPEVALATCRREGGDYADSCYLGVSANMKRFDPGRSFELCELVESDKLRRGCEKFALK